MNSSYAYAVAKLVGDVQFDTAYLGSDLKHLHTVIYPGIANAMWAGRMTHDTLSARMTDGIKQRLFEQGFVVRENTRSIMMHTISWGQHSLYGVDGLERKVSSKAFVEELDKLDRKIGHDVDPDDEAIARHEGRTQYGD